MLELARPIDREAVNALARQIHSLHVQWRPDLFEMAQELYPAQRFQEAMERRELYVARLAGVIVGYVLVKIRSYDMVGHTKRRVMLIDELCVEEACRGQGIGTEIMAEVRALAQAFGCTDMQLGVYPQNDAAIAFYQKCGFTIRSIDMQRKV